MKSRRKFAVVGIWMVLAAVVMGIGTGMFLGPEAPQAAVSAGDGSDLAMIPSGFSELAKQVRDGVVNIQVVRKIQETGSPRFRRDPFGDRNPFEGFFGPFGGVRPERKQQSVGSGCIISPDGYILTNNHVVEGADEIRVKLSDGREASGQIVGRDPQTDLALIRIPGMSNLTSLKLGDSDEIPVGSWVVAVGSPFGLEQTVTSGIVSAKGRVIGSGPYDDFIQTDASINPGNSGGPLINLKGEVIGINTAIVASGQGIGFAIPVNMAKEILPQLQQAGVVTRGLLGVSVQEVTPEIASHFRLSQTAGALVAMVTPDGPADRAGIQSGDVIVLFNRQPVAKSHDLPRMVASTPVGKVVPIQVIRDGKPLDLSVRIGEMKGEEPAEADNPAQNQLGISVQNLPADSDRKTGPESGGGVRVSDVIPGSPAAEAGLRVGDIIREVNRKPVANVSEWVREIESSSNRESILLRIERNRASLFVTVKPK